IRQAQLSEMVEALPGQYEAFVGERGVKLSGGQRQRIGIARALYKQANVIVFDEATSALDNETEKAVMEAISSLSQDLTILLIAHRLSTLQSCDRIIELKNGKVARIGTYDELILAPAA
ncbi:MAG TPA: ATP-binding cassette domain-containing protein, partial [Azospira sp.]|nr:ATP-binding cassette domain-containing protein [Azospira sp.]